MFRWMIAAQRLHTLTWNWLKWMVPMCLAIERLLVIQIETPNWWRNRQLCEMVKCRCHKQIATKRLFKGPYKHCVCVCFFRIRFLSDSILVCFNWIKRNNRSLLEALLWFGFQIAILKNFIAMKQFISLSGEERRKYFPLRIYGWIKISAISCLNGWINFYFRGHSFE